jgi:hypothetical protein
MIKEEIRDIYVEPIKLENFLRTEKKEIKIKLKEKINEVNSFNKKAKYNIPRSKEIIS